MKPARRWMLIAIGLVLLMQFNNCSGIIDKPPFGNLSGLSACDPPDPNLINAWNAPPPNTDCSKQDHQNLAIQPTGGDINVTSGMADFNIAGSCNEGAYALNVISWQLKLDGVLKRHSGMIYNGQAWNATCHNGQFLLYINLGLITEDPNNRTGLYAPEQGIRTQYSIDLIITGYDNNGQPYQNQVNGFQTINLNPL